MVTLSDNVELVKAIQERLKVDPHCPCRIHKTDDTICMCKEFREQIANQIEGACHCGLYVYKKE